MAVRTLPVAALMVICCSERQEREVDRLWIRSVERADRRWKRFLDFGARFLSSSICYLDSWNKISIWDTYLIYFRPRDKKNIHHKRRDWMYEMGRPAICVCMLCVVRTAARALGACYVMYCFWLRFFRKIPVYKVALQCFGVVGWQGVRFPANLSIKFALWWKVDPLV